MTPEVSRRGGPIGLPLACALYLALLSAGLAGPEPHLVATTEDGRVLATIPLAHDPGWHLAWRHSVTGILVRDYYVYRNGSMMLVESHAPAFDAGLGHIPGRGHAESDGNGGYWIRDLDEPVAGNAYWLRVGAREVDHTLVHGERRVRLSRLAPGERVRIAVTQDAPSGAADK